MTGSGLTQRQELAAVYRLAARLGLDDLLQVHFSVRLADDPGRMLLNRFGLLATEAAASNLVEAPIGLEIGAVAGLPLNPAGYMIHAAVYAARPDVQAVMHTHSPASMAVACLEEGLLPLSQYATLFEGDWAFHPYDGIVVDPEECRRLQANLGGRSVLLLRNHGSLVVAPSLPQSLYLTYYLEQACRLQMSVLSAGRPFGLVARDVSRAARDQLWRDGSIAGLREWSALLRTLIAEDPGFLE